MHEECVVYRIIKTLFSIKLCFAYGDVCPSPKEHHAVMNLALKFSQASMIKLFYDLGRKILLW